MATMDSAFIWPFLKQQLTFYPLLTGELQLLHILNKVLSERKVLRTKLDPSSAFAIVSKRTVHYPKIQCSPNSFPYIQSILDANSKCVHQAFCIWSVQFKLYSLPDKAVLSTRLRRSTLEEFERTRQSLLPLLGFPGLCQIWWLPDSPSHIPARE